MGDVLEKDPRKPFHKDLHPFIGQFDQLEDLADRSNGEEVLGLWIFEMRVTLANTSDEIILQYHLIQYSQGFIRVKKEGGDDVRKDERSL